MDNPFQSHQPPKAKLDNPFQPHQPEIATTDNPLQIRHEPPPTRHKRFADRLATDASDQPCDDCTRKDRVAQEYWNKNQELEEEVEKQAEFIERLKNQRKELEDHISKLLGQIDSMQQDQN
jgi:hypothetical protein